jgi:hypothetical protein
MCVRACVGSWPTEYSLRASYAEPSGPLCPFDCLGEGTCVEVPSIRTAAAAAAAAEVRYH